MIRRILLLLWHRLQWMINGQKPRWTSFWAGFTNKGEAKAGRAFMAQWQILSSEARKSFKYGNTLSTTYRTPLSTYGMMMSVMGVTNWIAGNWRTWWHDLSESGANLFLGVEYFFAPKLSIGGELNLGLGPSDHRKEQGRNWSNGWKH